MSSCSVYEWQINVEYKTMNYLDLIIVFLPGDKVGQIGGLMQGGQAVVGVSVSTVVTASVVSLAVAVAVAGVILLIVIKVWSPSNNFN